MRILLTTILGLGLIAACHHDAHASLQVVGIDLIYGFDGTSPGSSYGTIDLSDNENGGVNVTITANSANLMGADIRGWYFNLSDAFDGLRTRDFTLSDFGGVSDLAIGKFQMLGPNPPVAGGAGASFEWAVNFGNGAGKSGNGVLTTAMFNINAKGGLTVADFLNAELSYPNNTPAVLQAVNFQGTGILGASGGTVGGAVVQSAPEPASVAVWVMLGGICACVAKYRTRKRQS